MFSVIFFHSCFLQVVEPWNAQDSFERPDPTVGNSALCLLGSLLRRCRLPPAARSPASPALSRPAAPCADWASASLFGGGVGSPLCRPDPPQAGFAAATASTPPPRFSTDAAAAERSRRKPPRQGEGGERPLRNQYGSVACPAWLCGCVDCLQQRRAPAWLAPPASPLHSLLTLHLRAPPPPSSPPPTPPPTPHGVCSLEGCQPVPMPPSVEEWLYGDPTFPRRLLLSGEARPPARPTLLQPPMACPQPLLRNRCLPQRLPRPAGCAGHESAAAALLPAGAAAPGGSSTGCPCVTACRLPV
jgi:hypothetical protein